MEYNTMTRTRFFVGLETAENQLEIAPEEVIDWISARVQGGTFYEGKGLWMGERENGLVFEVMDLSDMLTDRGARELQDLNVGSAAGLLKTGLEQEFDQDSVLVERTEVDAAF